MRNDALTIPLLTSLTVHALALLLGSTAMQSRTVRPESPLPVTLVEVAPPPKVEKIKATPPAATSAPAKAKSIAPPAAPTNEEAAKATEAKPAAATKAEAAPSVPSSAHMQDGGGEARLSNISSHGESGFFPGSINAGGVTAAAGFGRAAGAPAPPAPTSPVRSQREAKAIQTARATYPPMALRAGLEGDVTLKIEVDAQGNVTKAEIIKSGGAGFDDEALKAVRQSRFEPAQSDGRNIAAEFTYIYRFRLRR